MDIQSFTSEVKAAYLSGVSIMCGITGWNNINIPWLNIQHLDLILTYTTRIVTVLVGVAAIINYLINWFKKSK